MWVNEQRETATENLGKFARFRKWLNSPVGKKVVIGSIFGIALVAAGWVAYDRYFKKILTEKPAPTSSTALQTKVASKLDGTLVYPEYANRHPLGIVIENHPDARPQTGLENASVIYETATEGGITRFLAMFSPYDSDVLGPVRSARTYFVSWISDYDAFFGHVGGNLDALEKIKQEGILDLDQFALGQKAYWRQPESGKAVEHTMYASTVKLYSEAENKGWPKEGSYTGWKFKDEVPLEQRPQSAEVTINFSSPTYKVNWQYDPNKNIYLRNMAGAPHKDKVTDNQLFTKNIVVQQVEKWNSPTTINEAGYAMKTVGSGNAYVFFDGKKIDATWKKETEESRTFFYDLQGNEIQFNAGPTWIEIMPPENWNQVTTS